MQTTNIAARRIPPFVLLLSSLLSVAFVAAPADAQVAPPGVGAEPPSIRLPQPARVLAQRRRGAPDPAAQQAKIRAAAAAVGLRDISVGSPSALYGVPGSGKITSQSALDAAQKFVQAFRPVYGLSDLKTVSMEDRPGFLPNSREVVVTRTVAGRPLFGARLRLHLGPSGEFIAAVGDIYGDLSWAGDPTLNADEAAVHATSAIDRLTKATSQPPRAGARANPESATEVAYPLGDVARPAFLVTSVMAADGIEMFDVVIDGISGETLEVISRTSHSQGQVFQNGSSVPQSPQPSTPGVVPPNPNPPAYVSRVTIPFIFLTGTTLSGNNANVREWQAYTCCPSYTPTSGNAITSSTADFSFQLNVGPGQPDIRNYPQASGTNLFYLLNYAHDYFYTLGFDEAHGNFQVDNSGRGGIGNDPVLAFAQLGSGLPTGGNANSCCNAWMQTPSDGSSPVMGMYIWGGSGTAPSRIYTTDSSLDPDVVLHEFTHGVTGRLSSGALDGLQAGAFNEGNSDFFALNMLVPSTAPLDGSYPVGTYSGQNFTGGIRYYVYSTNLTTNPLTYGQLGHVSTYGPEVHADGEIWANTLWEVRAGLIGSLGYSTGRTRVAQLVLDALQLLPNYPTYVDFRNAILAADQARYSGADLSLLWTAFAKRDLGFMAAGGFDGYSTHVLADTRLPSTGARVRLWENDLYVGESVRVLVGDSNASASSVVLTTNGGDSETVPLSASGSVFAGTIASQAGSVVAGNGKLELRPGDTITATTTDSNTGGGSTTLTATAVAHAPHLMSAFAASLFDPTMAPNLWFRGDEYTTSLTLPFSFPFYGQSFSKVYVNDNGQISFSFATRIRQRGLGETGAPPLIAPLSVDLDCRATTSGVYYYSGADRFTVRWSCVEYSAPSSRVNAAVSLFPDGSIRFDYGDGNVLSGNDDYTNAPDAATVGLVRGTDTFWQAVSGYDQSKNLGNVPSVRIFPGADCSLSNVAISGPTTGGCDGTRQTFDAGAGYATYSWSKDGVPVTGGTAQTLVVTTGGTYTVIVTNSSGCSGTASKTITYTTAPHPAIAGSHSFCPTGTGGVLDAGAGFTSYAWNKDGTPINGATSRTYAATAAGTYTVTVSNSTCSGTSAGFAVVAQPLTSPVIFGSSTVCSNGTITLETSAGYDTYQWSLGGSAIINATSRTLVASAAGTYTVQVTQTGCSATSIPKTVANCAASPVVFWVHVDDHTSGDADRMIEPAETLSLTVSIANSGMSALTGVSSTLSSSVTGVSITQATSTYPDIAASAVRSNAQAFTVTAACGSSLGLTLTLTSNQGTFAIPLNVSAATTGQDWRAAGPVGVDRDSGLCPAVYDPSRSKLLRFSSGIKWDWDGTKWGRLNLSRAVYPAVLVFDPVRDRGVSVLQNWNGSTYVYETWEFNPSTNIWAKRTEVISTPPLYEGTAAAFDAKRGVIVVFGGYDSSYNYVNTTAEFDGTSWKTVVSSTAPPARGYAGMTFDPRRGVIVMAGGYQNSSPYYLPDSWEFDGSQWTQGPSLPDGIRSPGLVYSPVHGGVVMATGYGQNSTFTSTLLYSGTAWTDVTQPLPRPLGATSLAFDERRRQLVAITSAGNVFENDGTGWTGRIYERPEATTPFVTYDPVRKVTVALPGSDYAWLAGTNVWDGSSWRNVAGSKPYPVGTVYAAFLGKTVAVDSNGNTLTFDGTVWTNLSVATKPMPAGATYLYSFALSCDSVRNRVVLFGGVYYPSGGSQTYVNDTWEFDGTNWSKRAPASSPTARSQGMMAFDPERSVTVLYGGSGSTNYSDVWEWNGTTWTQKTFGTPNPGAQRGGRMVYYPPMHGVLAWGNNLGPSGWLWNGTAWTALTLAAHIPYYYNMGLAYDSDRKLLVATDGASTFEFGQPSSCSINPHADVTVPSDTGKCGANITYTTPFTGVCGILTSVPASGSLFPIGTTQVTVTSTCGMTMTFKVTVQPAAGCAVVFTDDPLVPGQTVIKSIHLKELRVYVNLVRAQAGMQAATFTDSEPTGVLIKAQHIIELRNALDPARAALGKAPIPYARTTLSRGMTVLANDITELRNGVK